MWGGQTVGCTAAGWTSMGSSMTRRWSWTWEWSKVSESLKYSIKGLRTSGVRVGRRSAVVVFFRKKLGLQLGLPIAQETIINIGIKTISKLNIFLFQSKRATTFENPVSVNDLSSIVHFCCSSDHCFNSNNSPQQSHRAIDLHRWDSVIGYKNSLLVSSLQAGPSYRTLLLCGWSQFVNLLFLTGPSDSVCVACFLW